MGNLFKGLIILQVLTILVMVQMPDDPSNESLTSIVLIGGTITSLFFFVGLILLFSFNPWGRGIFTASVFLAIPLTLAIPQATIPISNLEGLLNWFGGALDGAMLAMMYLTSLKERFQKVKE
jgi:hypothetical protein